MKNFFCVLLLLVLVLPANSQHQQRKMFGITIDGINNINNIATSIARHSHKITTRIVFDEWIPATDYAAAVNKLDTVTGIMGELLDSYYVKDYSVAQYKARTDEYMSALGSKVDIWEIGNEVNGEWLGPADSVKAKINYAYDKARQLQYKSAITLYYNKDCWENPANEMFRWVNNNISADMKNNINYVFVSYYEDDCNNLQPNWQRVFDSLHVIFPNSMLGIGECGTNNDLRKKDYMYRYYTMRVTTPGFIGGYFWWYYRQDCVPWNTKPLWEALENAIKVSLIYSEPNEILDGDGY